MPRRGLAGVLAACAFAAGCGEDLPSNAELYSDNDLKQIEEYCEAAEADGAVSGDDCVADILEGRVPRDLRPFIDAP